MNVKNGVWMLEYAAAAKSLQSCLTLCRESPCKSSVVGCRLLLQRIKVKVKWLSRVQFLDPMDCSLPVSSIHGIFQARVLEWVAIPSLMLGYRCQQKWKIDVN